MCCNKGNDRCLVPPVRGDFPVGAEGIIRITPGIARLPVLLKCNSLFLSAANLPSIHSERQRGVQINQNRTRYYNVNEITWIVAFHFARYYSVKVGMCNWYCCCFLCHRRPFYIIYSNAVENNGSSKRLAYNLSKRSGLDKRFNLNATDLLQCSVAYQNWLGSIWDMLYNIVGGEVARVLIQGLDYSNRSIIRRIFS